MKRIISILFVFCTLTLYAQNKNFYQPITTQINHIEVDSAVENIFFYIDTTLADNKIIVSHVENVKQFAKVTDDTLIIFNPKYQNISKQPIISIYLNQFPNSLCTGQNSQSIMTVLQNICVTHFDIHAKQGSSLSFCMVYDAVFDSLAIVQDSRSDIYFSKLSVRNHFYLKTSQATFQTNDTDMYDNSQHTVLSHKSTIKIKGFTLE